MQTKIIGLQYYIFFINFFITYSKEIVLSIVAFFSENFLEISGNGSYLHCVFKTFMYQLR